MAPPPKPTFKAVQSVEFHCHECGATVRREVPEDNADFRELYEFMRERLTAFETYLNDIIAIAQRGDVEAEYYVRCLERLRDHDMGEGGDDDVG
jgi:hypothetical protein